MRISAKTFGSLVLRGALAGFLATLPMSATMLGLHYALPGEVKSTQPLPPEQITSELAADAEMEVSDDTLDVLTAVNHFLFGAGAGAIYGGLSSQFSGLLSSGGGILFAMAVWAASYQGWIPAFDILRPATDLPASRNWTMILSHVVWGLFLAYFTRVFGRTLFKRTMLQ
jgi:uncharacterized membrane protein YagU involved in acid resistance